MVETVGNLCLVYRTHVFIKQDHPNCGLNWLAMIEEAVNGFHCVKKKNQEEVYRILWNSFMHTYHF